MLAGLIFQINIAGLKQLHYYIKRGNCIFKKRIQILYTYFVCHVQFVFLIFQFVSLFLFLFFFFVLFFCLLKFQIKVINILLKKMKIKKKKRKLKRIQTLNLMNILAGWFSLQVSISEKKNKINISKQLVQKACKKKLVRKHFQKSHKFNEIFNLNMIKFSYRFSFSYRLSSMPNVKNLIKQHNSKILSKEQDKIQRSCNCRIK